MQSLNSAMRGERGLGKPSGHVRVATIMCRALRFSYGARQVLRGLDLAVLPGECLVLFGGNGAGKTTLVRILATLLRPSSGEALIAGIDVTAEPGKVRRLIGVMTHQMFLHPDLTARENLEFYAALYEVASARERIDEVLDIVSLARGAGELVRTMSRGMQQRLSLARALLHRPKVLLLDEPDTGLDVAALRVLEEVLAQRHQDGLSVLVTTHRLQEGHRLGDRFAILARGKLVGEVTKESTSVEKLERWYRGCLDGARL